MMPNYYYPPNISGYGGFGGMGQAGIQFPSLQLPMVQPPSYNQTYYQNTTYPPPPPMPSGPSLNQAFQAQGMAPGPFQMLTASPPMPQLPTPGTGTPSPTSPTASSNAFSTSSAVDPQQNLSFQQPQNNPLQGRKAPPRRGYFQSSSPLMSGILNASAGY